MPAHFHHLVDDRIDLAAVDADVAERAVAEAMEVSDRGASAPRAGEPVDRGGQPGDVTPDREAGRAGGRAPPAGRSGVRRRAEAGGLRHDGSFKIDYQIDMQVVSIVASPK